ncbi:Mth938-like domain-containing protein [Aromatoleum bremense]|uniref:Xcc1710-like domain-containing protein n=1 Tax=Aromatoleum bremense TaxID=76115 RepID=A0ABX1NUE0_9RHOO|nr:Mth938-like domain-containing protein [Aromatoleum bremense]NMG15621.1 hypothetical protein [Aromatoleum bremense]QTQ30600.1 putative protein DUf498 and DUF598 [Aromatoleum bremense]
MKLNLEQNPNLNLFTGYAADHVMVNKVRHEGNLIVTSERVLAWKAAGFDALAVDDFVALRELAPEVVLLGTGSRLRFPSPRVLRPLIDAGIGYEVMDLAAACRTYNILATEGRAVAAALIFDAP